MNFEIPPTIQDEFADYSDSEEKSNLSWFDFEDKENWDLTDFNFLNHPDFNSQKTCDSNQTDWIDRNYSL